MKREEVIQNLLYGILLSAFLLLYFILSINSRMAADDFYFLKNFETLGWWQSMIESWQSWVTRWSSVLLLDLFFVIFRLTGGFLFIHIISLLMLCFALYQFSSSAIDFFLRHKISKSKGLMRLVDLPQHSRFIVSFVISFFLLTPGTGEIFFWITSSSMYLWGFIALCLLLSEILNETHSVSTYLVCIPAALFIGGAAEAVSLPAAIILIVLIFFQARKKYFGVSTILSFILLAVSIGFSYGGEGRALRQSALPDLGFTDSLLVVGKSLVLIEMEFVKEKIFWIVLFFISWTGFAVRISLNVTFRAGFIFRLLIAYLILCIVLIAPPSILLGEVPPFRARILIAFLNCSMICISGILAAAWLQKSRIVMIFSSAAVLGVIAMIGKTALEQKEITGRYAQAVDARMQFLTTLVQPDDSSTIFLEALPPNGMLMSSEISTDTADFRNEHLEKFLGLKASLRIYE
jgi:hypothetical protein